MTELFGNTAAQKQSAAQPQVMEFKSAKGSKVKITYTPMVIGGIAKSPVLENNLKTFIDDFEKEAPLHPGTEVKDETKTP